MANCKALTGSAVKGLNRKLPTFWLIYSVVVFVSTFTCHLGCNLLRAYLLTLNSDFSHTCRLLIDPYVGQKLKIRSDFVRWIRINKYFHEKTLSFATCGCRARVCDGPHSEHWTRTYNGVWTLEAYSPQRSPGGRAPGQLQNNKIVGRLGYGHGLTAPWIHQSGYYSLY